MESFDTYLKNKLKDQELKKEYNKIVSREKYVFIRWKNNTVTKYVCTYVAYSNKRLHLRLVNGACFSVMPDCMKGFCLEKGYNICK